VKHASPSDFPCRLWVLCLSAAVVCSAWTDRAGAAGRPHRYGDVEITELDVPTATSSHGYVAYRFTVANRSKDTSHTVHMRLPRDSYKGSVTAGQTVEVAPGAVTTVSLFQPPLPMIGANVGIGIDGKAQRPISFNPVRHGMEDYWDNDMPLCVLAGRSVARGFREVKADMDRHPAYEFQMEVEYSDLPVSQWAANWLAYSRYDLVVVSSGELAAMPSSVREAVMRFVACGGMLLIAGQVDVPDSWKGRGYRLAGLNHYAVGFGMCIIAAKDLSDMHGGGPWIRLHKNWQAGARTWARTHSVGDANRMFPVVEDLRVPTGGMLAVMLAFAILAGPVNLIVLSRLHKRMWMFWTVPTISLVTCISVFLYTFIAEGWDGHARTAAITILDQRSHRAATIGWTAFYSPMTPGDGLHFGRETEVTPQWGQEQDYDDYRYGPEETTSRGELHTDWTSDQHLRGNWVRARVPAHFAVRKAETRRERLNVTVADDGSITVVNGLGARIGALYLADAAGRIHEASDIAPGAQAALTARPEREGGTAAAASAPDKGIGTLLRTVPPYAPHCTARAMLRGLRPNCYVADLDGAPFVEDALAEAKQARSRSVVYGIFGDSGGS